VGHQSGSQWHENCRWSGNIRLAIEHNPYLMGGA
jgi:hypothetical protein